MRLETHESFSEEVKKNIRVVQQSVRQTDRHAHWRVDKQRHLIISKMSASFYTSNLDDFVSN